MTNEELYEATSDTLQAMSDEELTKHFEPYFNVTRPERVAAKKPIEKIDPDLARRLAALQSMGINVSAKDMMRKPKK